MNCLAVSRYSGTRPRSPYRCTLNRSNTSWPALATYSKNCRGGLPGSLLNTSYPQPPSTTAAAGSASLTAWYMVVSCVTYSAAVPAHSRPVLLGSLSHCQYRTRPAQRRTTRRTNSPYARWS